MVNFSRLLLLSLLFLLGACASGWMDKTQDYREAFIQKDFVKASKILSKSDLKKDKESALLWHLEKGTVALELGDEESAISHLEQAQKLIDGFFTIRVSSELKKYLLNDRHSTFSGASYERSYTYYYLARAYYSRYLKSGNKLDLQGARATILAWDTFFTDFQRSAGSKTLYRTDLMLKVFGGQIHEVSGIRNDRQIALQLYKDALKILDIQGGIFSFFNSKNLSYIKENEEKINTGREITPKHYEPTSGKADLKDFLHLKILSLTKVLRKSALEQELKTLKPKKEVSERLKENPRNVVLVLEEGLIPQKVGKPFNIGLRGAMNSVSDSKAKRFIATVGEDVITAFAMNKLGMVPKTVDPGNFIFAHSVTKLAVMEAAISFELPMIDSVPLVQRQELFILDEKGEVVQKRLIPVVSENGDIARLVLEEDALSRYVTTGTRVAVRHILAIISAMQVYKSLSSNPSNDLLARTAALGSYIAASKTIAAMEKADTRHWTTLPQALRMEEFHLPPGNYSVAVGLYSGETAPTSSRKMIGKIKVKDSVKAIYYLKYQSP